MYYTCQFQHTSLFILLEKPLKIKLHNLYLYIFKVDLYLKPSQSWRGTAVNIKFEQVGNPWTRADNNRNGH